MEILATYLRNQIIDLFFELEFYSPVNTVKVMLSLLVNILTLPGSGKVVLLSSYPVLCAHTFYSN